MWLILVNCCIQIGCVCPSRRRRDSCARGLDRRCTVIMDCNPTLDLITVAARSKARTVFARSNAGIVGSNRNQGMDVCVYSVFVLSCVGSGLATGWCPVQGVQPTVLGLRNWSERKRFTDDLCSKVGAVGKRERESNLRGYACPYRSNIYMCLSALSFDWRGLKVDSSFAVCIGLTRPASNAKKQIQKKRIICPTRWRVWLRVFIIFQRLFHTNVRTVPEIWPRPLPSTYFKLIIS
jgi:hypothetical protein